MKYARTNTTAMTARMVKGFCLFTGVSDSHAIFAQNHKPRFRQCQAREAADVRGWTFEVGQKPRRRRKLEQRWHPHPGCLRKSGKERTYATRSAQEWQAKDLRGGIFALRCNGRVPEGVCHPGCFAERVRKLLKTKDGDRKKSAKREKECASRRKQRR